MIRTKDGASARRVPDCAEGKVAFDMHHTADRRQVLFKQSSGSLTEQLVTCANQEILRAGLIKNLLRVLNSLCKWLFDVDVTARFQCGKCQRRMGSRRGADVYDVRSF